MFVPKFATPRVSEIKRGSSHPVRVVKLSPATLKWEREVYEADPTGGNPSAY